MRTCASRLAIAFFSFLEISGFGVFAAIAAASVAPRDDVPANIDSLLQDVIVATVNQEYDHALEQIERVITLAPEEPIGYLFRAATLQSLMLDYEDYSAEKEFLQSLKTCRKLAEKKLRRHSTDPWAHFLLGSAYGYESFYLGKKKHFLQAVHTGWKCIKYLENTVRLDPKFNDAYLGIGTYKYYRSKLSNKLRLPFLPDETAEGIAMVRRAAAHGRYSRLAAVNALTWILLDEGRPQEAYFLADSVMQVYPGSRFFMWGAAESAARLNEHDRAREVYTRIKDTLVAEGKLSPYLEAVIRSKIARVEFNAGRAAEGCEQLATITTLKITDGGRRKRLEEEVEFLQKNCADLPSTSSGDGGR